MPKKILSLIVAVLMVTALIPAGAFAKGAHRAAESAETHDPELAAGFYFETAEDFAQWTLEDLDGDGFNWVQAFAPLPGSFNDYLGAYEGSGYVYSRSWYGSNGYKEVLEPDNWLISPAITLPETAPSVSFWAQNSSSSMAETIAVYVLFSQDADPQAVPVISAFEPIGYEYAQYAANLSEYAGETVHIAFRHYNCSDNFFGVAIDAVEIHGNADDPHPGQTPINEVKVNCWSSPIEGEVGIDNVFLETPEDAPYYIIYGGWLDETEGQQMWNEEHVFIEWHTYSEGCQIWCDEGYYFADDCVFVTDDLFTELDPEYCYVDPDENYICYMNTVPVVCSGGVTTVDTIYINGVELPPVAGEYADDHLSLISVPDDAPYHISNTAWYDDDTETEFHDVFAAGGHYCVYVSLALPGGYEFADDVKVIINDDPTLGPQFLYSFGDFIGIYTNAFECDAEPGPIAIHEVIVNGWGSPVEGVAGIDHMFLETPEDAPYYIIYGGWLDETDGQQMWSEEHVFIAGHIYSEGCQIWCDEGYYFADDCVFITEDAGVELDPEYCYVDPDADFICYMNIIPVVCESAAPGMLWGDADGDGDVDSADVLCLMRHVLGLVELDPDNVDPWCDVNGDGQLDLIDALLIMRKVTGAIEFFPVEMDD